MPVQASEYVLELAAGVSVTTLVAKTNKKFGALPASSGAQACTFHPGLYVSLRHGVDDVVTDKVILSNHPGRHFCGHHDRGCATPGLSALANQI